MIDTIGSQKTPNMSLSQNKVVEFIEHAQKNNHAISVIYSSFPDYAKNLLNCIKDTPQSKSDQKICVICDVSLWSKEDGRFLLLDTDLIQHGIEANGGALVFCSEQTNQVCVLYSPITPIELEVERFFSPQLADLLRIHFSTSPNVLRWLDHTENSVQKQKILKEIVEPFSPHKKKL